MIWQMITAVLHSKRASLDREGWRRGDMMSDTCFTAETYWWWSRISLYSNKQIHLVDESFTLKIHQNTTNYSYIVDVLVSIRDLHQRKKLVLVLPVHDTTRNWRAFLARQVLVVSRTRRTSTSFFLWLSRRTAETKS